MSPVERISPEEAFEQVSTGEALQLQVCVYEDDEKCRQTRLAQALTLRELEELEEMVRRNEVPRDRAWVLYCA